MVALGNLLVRALVHAERSVRMTVVGSLVLLIGAAAGLRGHLLQDQPGPDRRLARSLAGEVRHLGVEYQPRGRLPDSARHTFTTKIAKNTTGQAPSFALEWGR